MVLGGWRFLISEVSLYGRAIPRSNGPPQGRCASLLLTFIQEYMTTSLTRNSPPLGPCSKAMSRTNSGPWGGVDVSSERGTPESPINECFLRGSDEVLNDDGLFVNC